LHLLESALRLADKVSFDKKGIVLKLKVAVLLIQYQVNHTITYEYMRISLYFIAVKAKYEAEKSFYGSSLLLNKKR